MALALKLWEEYSRIIDSDKEKGLDLLYGLLLNAQVEQDGDEVKEVTDALSKDYIYNKKGW